MPRSRVCRRQTGLRNPPLDHLLVLRTLIRLGTVRAGMVVGTVNPTRTRANSGRRQGVRPVVVVILLREVAEVAQAVVEAVAVTTAFLIPPLRELLEVCPPPGAILSIRSLKRCRP